MARGFYSTGSVVVAHGLSCSSACGNLPGPGFKPVSPALADGFLNTAHQGKSSQILIMLYFHFESVQNNF